MTDQLRTYGFTGVLVISSFLAAFVSSPVLGQSAAFLFFYPTITLSAWYGGFKPGLFATIESAVFLGYVFIGGFDLLRTLQPTTLLQLCLFIGGGFLISYVIEHFRHTELVNEIKRIEKQ